MYSESTFAHNPTRVHAARGFRLSGCVVTIGAFDGVHLGHQQLVQAMVASARRQGLPAVIYTFDPLPKVFFGRARALISLEQRIGRLGALEPDHIVVAAFDDACRRRTAMEFIAELGTLNPRLIWLGEDFRFGAGQVGDVGLLTRYFAVRTLGRVQCDGGRVISSSLILRLLEGGDLSAAEALQGWHGLELDGAAALVGGGCV
ncbi:MAG TPA: FAD synthetase family protein [Reyranella sp.]|nr:FAD synthetase family protein [Reyranella sp.]